MTNTVPESNAAETKRTNTKLIATGHPASAKLHVVPGLWIVEVVQTGQQQTVAAVGALEAAAKVVAYGSTVELSASSVDCADRDTRLVYVISDDSLGASFWGAGPVDDRLYVKPVLAL